GVAAAIGRDRRTRSGAEPADRDPPSGGRGGPRGRSRRNSRRALTSTLVRSHNQMRVERSRVPLAHPPETGAESMFKALSALCGALVVCSASVAGAAGIRGDYVEARTGDVFTGPCFSNAEVFIYGKQAVLAWKVTEGSYNGVDLSGLTVAAAVQ